MKLQNKNPIIVLLLVLVFAFAVIMPGKGFTEDCDMIALISKAGWKISWMNQSPENFDDPQDYIEFIRDQSASHPNGYGILYYNDDGYFYYNNENPEDPDNQAWYSPEPYLQNPDPFDNAVTTIFDDDTESAIVLVHDRTGTGGWCGGNHPFRFEWEDEDRTYTFEHNGFIYDQWSDPVNIKYALWCDLWYGTDLPGTWFTDYTSNWVPPEDTDSWDAFIDSELLFHYIMKNIIEKQGDVITGIHSALTQTYVGYDDYHVNLYYYITQYYYSNIINIILSDGSSLYVFRNSGTTPKLSYKMCDKGFIGVKTQGYEGGTPIDQFDLVCISRYGEPYIIDDFLSVPDNIFVSGLITENTDWTSDKIITGDITVPAGITLNINSIVDFATNSNFNIEGDVNLNNGSELNLSNASTVTIDGTDAQLFLDWGSTITGSTPTTYEATPPGHQTGGEKPIPGDRIIAQNGGIITTNDDYQNPGDEITISSSSEAWDGIFIENPSDGTNYWFVNCDISGIQNISMKGDGNLSFYKSDLYDAGGIIVRDDATLTLKGCNVDGWINGYGSCVIMDEDNDGIGNEIFGNTWGSGIYLRYTSTNPSQIYNTNIHHNYYGCSISDHSAEFENCEIYENSWFGFVNGKLPISTFKSNQIRNNGAAEFIGNVDSYDGMVDCGAEANTIQDNVDSGGWDTYLLIATDWQEGDPQIDVSDNTFIPNDISRFFPQEAFIIENGIPEEKRILLSSAMEDMNNKNYDAADVTLKQIITDYPESNEAVVAVKCLYFIENFTDRNFAEFRAYLDEIQAEYGTPLCKMKEDVKTKTYMNEMDYLTAIERFEEIINNPPTPDDSIYAMIDEGYCYLKLAEDSTRAMPVNCSARPATFAKYQENVKYLESRLSFFNEPETEPYAQDIENALLIANYPNPFNSETTIRFSIPSATKVEISIYNIKGQKVCTLVDNEMEKGVHCVNWNGRDNAGKQVSYGIYLYKLKEGNRTSVKRMLMMK